MKELQRTVFFAAYDSAVFCPGNSVTEKDQRELLRKTILGSGDPDELTLPEQMVLGINQFGHLYEDVPVAANEDRNAAAVVEDGGLTSSRNEYDRRLKAEGLLFSTEEFRWHAFYLCKQARWHYKIFADIEKFNKPRQCLGSHYDERCQGSAQKWEKGARLREGFRQ